jgi:hypothetical protein
MDTLPIPQAADVIIDWAGRVVINKSRQTARLKAAGRELARMGGIGPPPGIPAGPALDVEAAAREITEPPLEADPPPTA